MQRILYEFVQCDPILKYSAKKKKKNTKKKKISNYLAEW